MPSRFLRVWLVTLFLTACDPAPEDPHMGLLLPRCEESDPEPAMPLPHVPSTLVGTVVPVVARATVAGNRNPTLEFAETRYRSLDYHLSVPGPGEDHTVRTDLGERIDEMKERRSLACF